MKKMRIAVPALLVVLILSAVAFASRTAPENRYSGVVEADAIDISAEVGGKVTSVFADEGQKVDTGDLLMQLDSVALNIEKEKTESMIRIGELRLETLVDGPRSQEISGAKSEVRALDSQVLAAAEDYERAKDVLEDNRILLEAGAIPEAAYKNSESNFLKAEENMKAFEERRNKAESAYELLLEGADENSKSIAYEELLLKKAELKAIEYRIEKTVFKAPAEGYVKEYLVSEGEFVSPGMRVAVFNKPKYHVKFFIPERDLNALHVGDAIFMDFDGQRLPAKITFISDSGEFTPKNIESSESKEEIVFRARADLVQNPDWIKPGMFVDILLEGGRS